MSKTTKLVIIGLVLAIVGLVPILALILMIGVRVIPTLLGIAVIATAVIAIILSVTRAAGGGEKPKRSMGQEDRYTMLEQMVDDLSTTERRYLQRLLDEKTVPPARTLHDLVTDDGEMREKQPKP